MPTDATIITLASLAVAATAGVAGPAITSWSTTSGQRRLFAHQKVLHDRDDLRRNVDEVAERLDALPGLAHKCLETLSRHGPKGEETRAAADAALAGLQRASFSVARLALRVPASDPTPARAQESVNHFLDVVSMVDKQASWKDWDDDYVHAKSVASITKGQEASAVFVEAARDTLAI